MHHTSRKERGTPGSDDQLESEDDPEPAGAIKDPPIDSRRTPHKPITELMVAQEHAQSFPLPVLEEKSVTSSSCANATNHTTGISSPAPSDKPTLYPQQNRRLEHATLLGASARRASETASTVGLGTSDKEAEDAAGTRNVDAVSRPGPGPGVKVENEPPTAKTPPEDEQEKEKASTTRREAIAFLKDEHRVRRAQNRLARRSAKWRRKLAGSPTLQALMKEDELYISTSGLSSIQEASFLGELSWIKKFRPDVHQFISEHPICLECEDICTRNSDASCKQCRRRHKACPRQKMYQIRHLCAWMHMDGVNEDAVARALRVLGTTRRKNSKALLDDGPRRRGKYQLVRGPRRKSSWEIDLKLEMETGWSTGGSDDDDEGDGETEDEDEDGRNQLQHRGSRDRNKEPQSTPASIIGTDASPARSRAGSLFSIGDDDDDGNNLSNPAKHARPSARIPESSSSDARTGDTTEEKSGQEDLREEERADQAEDPALALALTVYNVNEDHGDGRDTPAAIIIRNGNHRLALSRFGSSCSNTNDDDEDYLSDLPPSRHPRPSSRRRSGIIIPTKSKSAHEAGSQLAACQEPAGVHVESEGADEADADADANGPGELGDGVGQTAAEAEVEVEEAASEADSELWISFDLELELEYPEDTEDLMHSPTGYEVEEAEGRSDANEAELEHVAGYRRTSRGADVASRKATTDNEYENNGGREGDSETDHDVVSGAPASTLIGRRSNNGVPTSPSPSHSHSNSHFRRGSFIIEAKDDETTISKGQTPGVKASTYLNQAGGEGKGRLDFEYQDACDAAEGRYATAAAELGLGLDQDLEWERELAEAGRSGSVLDGYDEDGGDEDANDDDYNADGLADDDFRSGDVGPATAAATELEWELEMEGDWELAETGRSGSVLDDDDDDDFNANGLRLGGADDEFRSDDVGRAVYDDEPGDNDSTLPLHTTPPLSSRKNSTPEPNFPVPDHEDEDEDEDTSMDVDDDHGSAAKTSGSTGAGVAIHTAGHPEAEDQFTHAASTPSNGDSNQDVSALEGKHPDPHPHPHPQAQVHGTIPNLLPLQATTAEDHDHEGGSESRVEMDVDEYANGGERCGKNVNDNVLRVKKVQDDGGAALEVEVEDEPMLGVDGGGGAASAAGAWNRTDDSEFSGRKEEVEGLGRVDLNHHVDSDENEAVDLDAHSGLDDGGACVGDSTDSRTDNERAGPPVEDVNECTVGNGIGDGDGERTIGRRDTAPEFEVGTVNHTKALSCGAGADDDSAFEGKQPDGYSPNLLPFQPTTDDANDGDEGGGSVNVDVVRLKKGLDESGCGGGSRGAGDLEVGIEVERAGGRGAAGGRDHTNEFSGHEEEGINPNRNIEEDEAGDLDAHNGLDDDGAGVGGQVDSRDVDVDETVAEPPTDDENTVDNGEGSDDDKRVGDIAAPDIDQEDDDDDDDSSSRDRGAEDSKTPAEPSSTPNNNDEIRRLRQALADEQKTSARLRAELEAQSKHQINFLASLSLPTSILRREELHFQTDQLANTQKLQDALHTLQDVVDREVEVCMFGAGVGAWREGGFEGGGDEYDVDVGAVELEKQNGKRGRRLLEEDEDGVDDLGLGEPRESENFSVEEPPRSRFKRARIE